MEKNWAKLCINHSDTFDKWFDKDEFDWEYSFSLAEYCLEHFDKWWDEDKYDWEFSFYLARYCSEHFDKWFDKDKFNWIYSKYLPEFCSEHILKWYPYCSQKGQLDLTPVQIAKLRIAKLL